MSSPTTIRVALDWTPNTIHTGLYVALSRNFYTSHNLSVELLPPGPSYSTTPAKRLENGTADLAVCPSESCIAYHESGKQRLQAIYAILQRDASAIVSTKLSRPAELGHGVYGSYNARYEDDIVRAIVTKDGGDAAGMRIEREAGKLGLFDAVKKGDVDATWVFMPWEGVEAEMEGTQLHVFRMEEYGVPYGYSPVIARDAATSAVSEEALRAFVKATGEGYAYAMQHVEEAANILGEHCQPRRSKEFLESSQRYINDYYGSGGLGRMQKEKWKTWVEWLQDQGLLKTKVNPDQLFTDAFF